MDSGSELGPDFWWSCNLESQKCFHLLEELTGPEKENRLLIPKRLGGERSRTYMDLIRYLSLVRKMVNLANVLKNTPASSSVLYLKSEIKYSTIT